jgi:tetratricopeptide (TPR) repeat protein
MAPQRTAFWLCLCALLALSACSRARPPQVPSSLAEVPAEELFRKGAEFAQRGDWVAAEQYLQAARRAGADERRVVANLVKVCLASERYQTALSYAEPYVARHPSDWRFKQVVGTILVSQGRLLEAQELLEEVIRQEPGDAGTHLVLAALEANHFGRPEAAQSHYEAYLSLEPTGEYASEARHWIAQHALRKERHADPESLERTP